MSQEDFENLKNNNLNLRQKYSEVIKQLTQRGLVVSNATGGSGSGGSVGNDDGDYDEIIEQVENFMKNTNNTTNTLRAQMIDYTKIADIQGITAEHYANQLNLPNVTIGQDEKGYYVGNENELPSELVNKIRQKYPGFF